MTKIYRHASGASLKIIKEWKPVLNQVRDNQALTSSLRNSSYYSQFAEQIGIWERKIADLELFLHHLSEIQRKWVYLEPIFGRGSLPSEGVRFNRIDAEFRIIINDISRWLSKFIKIKGLRTYNDNTVNSLYNGLEGTGENGPL